MNREALLIIDIQNDYLPGGAFPLPAAERAASIAERLLSGFRNKGLPIVHIKHEAVHEGASFFLPGTDGMTAPLAPAGNEPVMTKHRANAFLGTNLKSVLKERGIRALTVCGMMTNNCVDATVRAAVDMGYACTLVHDACAAAPLSFDGVDVTAAQVHAAFTAALGFAYCPVVSCDERLAAMKATP